LCFEERSSSCHLCRRFFSFLWPVSLLGREERRRKALDAMALYVHAQLKTDVLTVGDSLLCRFIFYNNQDSGGTPAAKDDKGTANKAKGKENVFSWATVQVHGEFMVDPTWITLPIDEPESGGPQIQRPSNVSKNPSPSSSTYLKDKQKNPTALRNSVEDVGTCFEVSHISTNCSPYSLNRVKWKMSLHYATTHFSF